jgi:hypothetical protein
MEIFEKAARLKLRFDSPKGALSVEDLWDVPLTSGVGKANLDDIAKGLYRQLRDTDATVSFVLPVEKGSDTVQLKFDIAKHVIDIRMAERDAAADAAKRKETKARILELIAKKQDDALGGKSLEELLAMANAL